MRPITKITIFRLFLLVILLIAIPTANPTTNETNPQLIIPDHSVWLWDTTDVISTDSDDGSFDPILKLDDQDNLHVVWYDYSNITNSGIDSDIFYRSWSNSSKMWDTDITVISVNSTMNSFSPHMVIDSSNNLHVVWDDLTNINASGSDRDIFYRKYDLSQDLWSQIQLVSTTSGGASSTPRVAIDASDNLHITWSDQSNNIGSSGGDADVLYRMFDTSMQSWTSIEVVSTESVGHSYAPDMIIDSNDNPHIAWTDLSDYAGAGTGDYDVFYKMLNRSSDTWTLTTVLSESTSVPPTYLSMDVDQHDGIHIVWADTTDYFAAGTDSDIFYRHYNQSNNWEPVEVVSTESQSDSVDPSLILDDDGNVLIAWHDSSDYQGSGTDEDIFYKIKHNTTGNWDTTQVVSTESGLRSQSPSIDVDGYGHAHIVWFDLTAYDNSGSDYDIFYKHNDPELPTETVSAEYTVTSTKTENHTISETITETNVLYTNGSVTHTVTETTSTVEVTTSTHDITRVKSEASFYPLLITFFVAFTVLISARRKS